MNTINNKIKIRDDQRLTLGDDWVENLCQLLGDAAAKVARHNFTFPYMRHVGLQHINCK